jgi:hypothetical protein
MMKTLLALVIVLLVTLPVAAQDTLALALTCWERPEPGAAGNMWLSVHYSGAPSSWGGSGLSWSTPGLPDGQLVAGDYPHAVVASVDGLYPLNIIQLWTDEPYSYAEIAFTIDTEAPECSEMNNSANDYGPDGGWVEIEIGDPPCDPCAWEVGDEYGNWHEVGAVTPVQDEGGGRFTRLVLGHDNPVTDPARYRVR